MMYEVFNRRDDESINDYINRVCDIREDYGVTWNELAKIINNECDLSYSESKYRKAYNAKMLSDAMQKESVETLKSKEEDTSDEQKSAEELLRTIRLEKVKLSDERVQNNAILRRISREETLKEIAKETADVMCKELPLTSFCELPHTNYEKEAILMISDWHYGMVCDNYWNKYDTDIAKERIATLYAKVSEYCKDNEIRRLHLVNLGDLICGRIHLPLRINSRVDTVTQTMEISEILAEFIDKLSSEMNIEYYDCLDNHSRIEPNKESSLELESFARMIPWYLKSRLSSNWNVHINENKYDPAIISFDVLGHKILGVHGDNDRPQGVVDSLTMMTREPSDLILTAHFHHFSCDEKNETLVVSNSCLMGTDTYAKNLRLSSRPSQNLIICSKDNPMEILYRIPV